MGQDEHVAMSILRRLIEADQSHLSAGAAEAVLQFRFSDADQAKLSVLAAKSNEGTLSSAEEVEYDGYLAVSNLLALWKSRARQSLKHSSAVST